MTTKRYNKFRSIIKSAFLSENSANDTVRLIIDFLRDSKITLRSSRNKLAAINFISADLSDFLASETNPLALGLVYIKIDNTVTQDFYIFESNSENYRYLKTDRELKRNYPKLYGGHKKKFNIQDFNPTETGQNAKIMLYRS